MAGASGGASDAAAAGDDSGVASATALTKRSRAEPGVVASGSQPKRRRAASPAASAASSVAAKAGSSKGKQARSSSKRSEVTYDNLGFDQLKDDMYCECLWEGEDDEEVRLTHVLPTFCCIFALILPLLLTFWRTGLVPCICADEDADDGEALLPRLWPRGDAEARGCRWERAVLGGGLCGSSCFPLFFYRVSSCVCRDQLVVSSFFSFLVFWTAAACAVDRG